MILRHKISLIVGLFAALALTSCQDYSDEFLTKTNPNKLSLSSYWTGLSDCNEGLTAVYNTFQDKSLFLIDSEAKRSDICWPGSMAAFPISKDDFYLHSFNSSNSDIGKNWATLYTGIFRANQVIEALDRLKVKYTSESDIRKWELLMGQARFFRGLFHHYLNISFNNGNIPIVNFVPEDESEFYRPCDSSERVKEFVRQEMKYAESVLPVKGDDDDWSFKTNSMGRVTSGAASAILGTSYLYDEMYDEAKIYFEKIINNRNYKLAGAGDNWTTKSEFNSESILEINYTLDHYIEGQLTNLYNKIFTINNFGGNTKVVPSYWLLRDFTMEPIDKLNPNYEKIYIPTDEQGDLIYSLDGSNPYMYRNYVSKTSMATYPVILKHGKAADLMKFDDTKKAGYRAKGFWDDSLYCYNKSVKMAMVDDKLVIENPTTTVAKYATIEAGPAIMLRPWKGQRQEGTYEIYSEEVDGETKYYRYATRSLRAQNSILHPTDTDYSYYGYNNIADKCNLSVWGMFKKYTNYNTRQNENDVTGSYSDINFRVIRLADIYLMYAEALIKGGTDEAGVSMAMNYINKVRERAGTVLIGSENDANAEFKGQRTYQDSGNGEVYKDLYKRKAGSEYYNIDNFYYGVISTAEQVMNHLMYIERPLELCVEGYSTRFVDLRRWGIVKQRFQELAKWEFGLVGYIQYKTPAGGKPAAKSQNSRWYFDYRTDNYAAWGYNRGKGPFVEFEQPAALYDDTKAYYPIPTAEAITNPYIIKVAE